jgi:hypothetical protein
MLEMIRELVRALLAWAVTLIALLFATNARAAECFPIADLFGALAVQYGEAPQDQGLASDGNLMQLWASKAGTWTLVIVTPQGKACMIGSGGDFADAREAAKPNL